MLGIIGTYKYPSVFGKNMKYVFTKEVPTYKSVPTAGYFHTKIYR